LTGIWPEARTVLVGSAVLCIAFGISSIPFYCLQDRTPPEQSNRRSVGVEVSQQSASELENEQERQAAAEQKEKIVHELFPGFPMDEETLLGSGSGRDHVICAICLEPVESGNLTVSGASCEHLFHRTCVLQWLTKRDDNTCPTCRSPMWTDDQYEEASQIQPEPTTNEQQDDEA